MRRAGRRGRHHLAHLFAIVNEYRAEPSGELIYHFDFYRIKKLDEVYDMGYEDYFYSGALCFIEWPELIEELLPGDATRVTIAEQPDGSRTVTLLTAGSNPTKRKKPPRRRAMRPQPGWLLSFRPRAAGHEDTPHCNAKRHVLQRKTFSFAHWKTNAMKERYNKKTLTMGAEVNYSRNRAFQCYGLYQTSVPCCAKGPVRMQAVRGHSHGRGKANKGFRRRRSHGQR